MDWDLIRNKINEISNIVIFDIKGSNFTLLTIIYLIVALWLLFFLSKKFSLLLQNKVLDKRIREPGARYSIATILRYFIVFIGFIFIVQSAGFDMTSFGLMAGALGVGIGFGLQNLFSDFVSGIILLFDSSVKVGDVIDVDGLVCTVTKINLRTTQVLTRDDKYILLPNTLLTKNRIINWTHNIENSRFDISVGVDYSSDVELVMRLLKESAVEQEGVDKTPEPFVRFNEYGDSALLFTVYFWSSNVFRVENTKSEIRRKIFHKFEENSIIIPFPQRTLHFHQNNNDSFFPDNNKKKTEKIMNIEFKINENQQGSFFIEKDGRQIAELDFEVKNNVLNAYHTGVRPELEGQGIAGKLFDEMVKYVRENGYKVIPSCSYIHAKFRRNPEGFADIWYRTDDEPTGDACGVKPK